MESKKPNSVEERGLGGASKLAPTNLSPPRPTSINEGLGSGSKIAPQPPKKK